MRSTHPLHLSVSYDVHNTETEFLYAILKNSRLHFPWPPSSFTKGRAGTSWLHSEQELYYFSPPIHFVSLTTPPATPSVFKRLNYYFHHKACCSCTCVPYDTILIKQWTLLCLLLYSFRIYTFKFCILFSALINVFTSF
jgi:hypothetical protein